MQARKEANKICKEKKKHWLNNRIKQVEKLHKQKRQENFSKIYRPSKMIDLPPYLLVKMKMAY
jgi:hypothetical protein